MQTIFFLSSQPFDHVPRALDMLRKMHFGLCRLTVEQRDQTFYVAITFEQRGDLSASVFIDRIAQLDGLIFTETGKSPLAGCSNLSACFQQSETLRELSRCRRLNG